MRINEIIVESLSRIVYHYTRLGPALDILTSGYFQLSSSVGSIEQSFSPKGKHYFLSTTRTKTGGFHSSSTSGVMFVLDGNWYNQRYRSTSVDYWQDRDSKRSFKPHEAEDRLFSAEPTVPIGGVKQVHVLVTSDAHPTHRSEGRKIILAAKQRGIPVYYYDDISAWRNLDIRHTGNVQNLTGIKQPSKYSEKYQGSLRSWVELIYSKNKTQLSRDAKEIIYDFPYSSHSNFLINALNTQMTNFRKPDSGPDRKYAVKVIEFMTKNGMNTVKELIAYLAQKWK